MVTLAPGKTLRATQPTLVVDNAFDPGRHLFRLTVVDDSGNESAPFDLIVSVEKPAPPPPKTPVGETPPIIVRPPLEVSTRATTTIDPSILLRTIKPQ
jgi:hypothetical protein